jgi:hypothetical protein
LKSKGKVVDPHLKLVEANQPIVLRNVFGHGFDWVERRGLRAARVAHLLDLHCMDPFMNVGHKGIEVDALLPVQLRMKQRYVKPLKAKNRSLLSTYRATVVEQIHQHRLATTHRPIDVQTLRRVLYGLGLLLAKFEKFENTLILGGRVVLDFVVDGLQCHGHLLLVGVGLKLSALDLLIECENWTSTMKAIFVVIWCCGRGTVFQQNLPAFDGSDQIPSGQQQHVESGELKN